MPQSGAIAGRCLSTFELLRNEELGLLGGAPWFDGALSNFSGLNCVEDPRQVAVELGRLVKAGGAALICVSTRVCLWEIAWYGARGNFAKAFRRVYGKTIARLDGIDVPVWYPTIRAHAPSVSPWFRVRSVRAVGLFVPPSYVESWVRKAPEAAARIGSDGSDLRGVAGVFAASEITCCWNLRGFEPRAVEVKMR